MIQIKNKKREVILTVNATTLAGANFKGLDLTGANFKGQDLTGANFSGAILNGANFNGATLINTNFDNSKMKNVYMSKAIVKKCSFNGTDVWGLNLTGSIFHDIELRDVDCSLRINVRGTDLKGVNVCHGTKHLIFINWSGNLTFITGIKSNHTPDEVYWMG